MQQNMIQDEYILTLNNFLKESQHFKYTLSTFGIHEFNIFDTPIQNFHIKLLN